MLESLENITKDLHDPSKGKRFQALQAVRKLRPLSLVPELRALYDRERNFDMRREILKALADIGGEDAVEGLLDALISHSFELRLEAARRLARIKPESAKEALRRVLEGEEWDLIRLIIEAFEPPYGTRDEIPLLLSVIQKAPNPSIKYIATRTINKIQEG